VAFRRGPVTLVLSPALVQGEFAPESLLKALDRIERDPRIEVVIIGRGGGASEDLMAFNDERVVRRVASLRIPCVSAVGHEIDTSLTDLVAAKCKAAVLLGEMSDRIEAIWKNRLPCHNVGRSLELAVKVAHAHAAAGDIVLFSPGTSSFDMFKNYADRGNQFRALVQALT
jgi:hypothetical protein